eukprot:GFKZ01007551.1.p1 GENE.GFKZ01007551.1~~GFKZ01007551.1.p1  ORF type:complete len:199 (+),score=33.57 GFKZ01007551.1:165-761(+)
MVAPMLTRARFTAASGKPLNARRAISLRMEAKNGLFYSTSSGKTQDVAELIKEKLGDAVEGPFEPDEANLADYDNIIAGAPTWNTGADEDRSGTSWDQVGASEMGDLSGKTVAVFGLGDSVSYGDYFCDAMGELHDKFAGAGAKMVGYVGTDDYEYEDSKSVKSDKFVGLALDEDNEDDKTDPRLEAWLAQLKTEMSM